jgi:predicted aldo/keto reductase-like oxidoreductase
LTADLGFGFMRLPRVGGRDTNPFDTEAIKPMVDRFLDAGYKYFDVAYNYWHGDCEIALKETLVDRYPRDSYLVADKLAYFEAADYDSLKDQFKTSLARTGLEYFDYYLLHSLTIPHMKDAERTSAWKFIREVKSDGRARHIGFSFHGKADLLEEILQTHPYFEFVQLQINYLDWDSESVQARNNYEVAVKHGKKIVIMEPVRGGGLSKLKSGLTQKMNEIRNQATIASWAFRFLFDKEGISTILSGMTTMEQMDDNINTFCAGEKLSPEEISVLTEVTKDILAQKTTGCTFCGYCLKGCPEHIKIPQYLRILDNWRIYSSREYCRHQFRVTQDWTTDKIGCIKCGKCESSCPQELPIIDYLAELEEMFK